MLIVMKRLQHQYISPSLTIRTIPIHSTFTALQYKSNANDFCIRWCKRHPNYYCNDQPNHVIVPTRHLHQRQRKRILKEDHIQITMRSSSILFSSSSPGDSYHTRNHRIYRTMASSSTNKHPFEKTFGLAFTISPDQAMDKFLKWAQIEQGLNTYIMNPTRVQVTAAYCPVWSFDLNLRFIVTNTTTKRKRLDWKPEIFQSVYGTQSIVHLPGLSAYAGYNYRRTLIDPLHNTTLVFMYDNVVPFGAWMLRDMKMMSNNRTIPIVPDPWNAPPGRALSVVKDGLGSLTTGLAEDEIVQVHAEVITSRRVYMPTYVIQYYILGMEYVVKSVGLDLFFVCLYAVWI